MTAASYRSRAKQAGIAVAAMVVVLSSWIAFVQVLRYAYGEQFMLDTIILRSIIFLLLAAASMYAVLRWQARKHALQDETYEALMADAADAIFLADASGRYLEVNNAACKLLGYSREELLKLSAPDVIDPADADGLSQRAGELKDGKDVLSRRKLRRKDGGLVEVESLSRRLQDGRILGIVRDVSMQSRFEKELKRNEERMRAIVSASLDAIITIDRDGAITEWNPAAEKMFQRSREEAVGKKLSELIIPPALRQRHEAGMARMRASGESTMFSKRLEMSALRRDGSEFPVELTITKSGDSFCTGFVRDLSESKLAREALRASEDRYRKLVEYAGDAVVLATPDGTPFFASPAIERIMGYAPEEFCKINGFTHVHPDDLVAIQALVSDVIQTPGKTNAAMFRVRHKKGHYVWLDMTLSNGAKIPGVEGLIANVRNVTERVELQERLHQSTKMEAIGRLAGGVAHDFNNLLTAIIGFSELLLARDLEPRARDFAQQISSAAARASDLTRQLLAFSRRQILQPRLIDINDRIRDMEKLLRRVIGEDIELVTSYEADLPKVKADPGQIEQVIMNLCVNARDAMPKGGKLTIRTHRDRYDEDYCKAHAGPVPGEYVLMSITDNGVGMTEETRARLFEPFFTTKERGKGTGLGLAAVYGIVKQSGGHIFVNTELNKGSEFTVCLPAAQDGEEPEETDKAVITRARGREHILVAEDEAIVRDLVCEALRSAGYKVTAAVDGEDALKRREEAAKVDLLVTDVVMPRLGGKALAETLKARQPGLPVIYMSGYASGAIVQDGELNAGVNFIQKPFSPDLLLKRVREALDNGHQKA